MFDFFVLIALAAGFLSFLSPCILPLIPSYISFVAGSSLSEITEGTGDHDLRKRIIFNSILFILGFSTIFVALGASASLAGQLIYEHRLWITRIGGCVVIFFGLYTMGVFRLSFLDKEKRFHLTRRPIGYWGTPLIGATFAAGWTPCVGPILGSILFYASTTKSIVKGIILLSFYSLGLAIPFFLSSLALNFFLHYYARFRKNLRLISIISGCLLVAIGILLVTDTFSFLSFSLLQLPG